MTSPRPPVVDPTGDQSVLSPGWDDKSLLASERGTNRTRRIETDSDGNLLVSTGAGSSVTISGEVEVKNDTGNPLSTEISPASASTVTSVAASTSSVILLADNPSRKMVIIYNDSAANLFLKLGITASSSSFSVKLTSGALYELVLPVYTGRIDAIWDIATGNARVTELS